MRKVGLVIVGALGATALVAGLYAAVAGGTPPGGQPPGQGHGPGGAETTCDGTLASGDYHRLVVPPAATCDASNATIGVRGGLRVGDGATFNGTDATLGVKGGIRIGDGATFNGTDATIDDRGPVRVGAGTMFTGDDADLDATGGIRLGEGATFDGTTATLGVKGGIRVGEGATFMLGQDGGTNTGSIRGGIHANAPLSVQVHFAHIRGGVRMHDGGSPVDETFSTVEDNHIHGGAAILDYHAFWLGFIRNTVHGTVRFNGNVMGDPDANEVVTNTIKGNLVCHDNDPDPQFGDSGGSPNDVSGQKVDQCADL